MAVTDKHSKVIKAHGFGGEAVKKALNEESDALSRAAEGVREQVSEHHAQYQR